jgi:hypothetical protein
LHIQAGDHLLSGLHGHATAIRFFLSFGSTQVNGSGSSLTVGKILKMCAKICPTGPRTGKNQHCNGARGRGPEDSSQNSALMQVAEHDDCNN